jgi:type IV fimbrial biogenesis protein FimT
MEPYIRRILPNIGTDDSDSGFTLIEMLVTLSVAGVLIAIALPSIATFLQSNRLSAATNDLLADFNYARSEVLKRNVNGANVALNAGVCKSDNGTSCTNTGTWGSGWIVFVDNDASGGWTGGDVMLRAHEGLPTGTAVAASADVVLYNNRGLLSGGVGSYTLCNGNLRQSRIINIGPSGRPSMTRGTC